MKWSTQAQLMLETVHGDRRLHVTVAPMPITGKWIVFALQGPRRTNDVSGVLDDHAHHVVGENVDLVPGIAAAEAYARTWLDGQPTDERCACPEIETKEAHHARDAGDAGVGADAGVATDGNAAHADPVGLGDDGVARPRRPDGILR